MLHSLYSGLFLRAAVCLLLHSSLYLAMELPAWPLALPLHTPVTRSRLSRSSDFIVGFSGPSWVTRGLNISLIPALSTSVRYKKQGSTLRL
ncbi:hypothetical protein GGS21DRAFT_343817, partial [Xylaria nigripes]